jgi:quinol-cytochrome oxidoreductase complex cytochrome b subunit
MRRITSIILTLAFIVVAITGVQLDFSHASKTGGKPPVMQSNVEGNSVGDSIPTVAHQASFYPKAAHKWAGYLFIVAGFMHLGLNIGPMRSYLGLRQ